MARLDIAAIRAAGAVAQTQEITLPGDAGTVIIRRLAYGDMVEAGNLPTARERNAAAFRLAVVDPPMGEAEISALLDDPALIDVATALGDAINTFNRRTTPAAEVVKAESAAFPAGVDAPDASGGAGPV